MRLIDADALVERTEAIEDFFVTNWTTEKVQRLIHEAPTIDAVPVVRSIISTHKWLSRKPQTNADRIRAMSDEELAELLFFGFEEDDSSIVGGMRPIGDEAWMRTVDEMLKWLQQPVKDGENE